MKFIGYCALWAAALGIGYGLRAITEPTPSPISCPEAGDTGSLFARLAPVVKKPRYDWEDSVTVRLTPRRAKVELVMPNGDKYSGEAATLGEAVSRITQPSDELRRALEGWSAPR